MQKVNGGTATPSRVVNETVQVFFSFFEAFL